MAFANEAWAQFDQTLISLVTQARDLRAQTREGLYSQDQGPEALHTHLLTHRRVLDVLEGYVVELARVKARLDLELAATRAVVEDRETEAVGGSSPWAGEFMSAQERNARLRGESLEERMAARQAERRLAEVAAAYDYVRTLYRGLEQSRNDLVARMRLVTQQSSLEKG